MAQELFDMGVPYVGKIKPKFLRDVERNLNDVCLDL